MKRRAYLLDGRAADAGQLEVGPIRVSSRHVSGSVAHEGVPFVGLHPVDLHAPCARRVAPHHGMQQRPERSVALTSISQFQQTAPPPCFTCCCLQFEGRAFSAAVFHQAAAAPKR